jgi:hypothetical protein
MDRSDRLREDQEQLNRNREYQIQDRRSFIRSTKTELRIADLNRQIAAAERQRQRDEAGDEMRAQWPKTRAAVEHCTAVTPELRQAWLDRLESIQYKRSAPIELDDLASDVNRIADGLAKIAQDLDRAAKLRNSYPLAGPLPWPPREPMHSQPYPSLLDRLQLNLPTEELPRPAPMLSRLHPSLSDRRQFNLLAEDLEPIQGRILALSRVPVSLCAEWLSQLAQIDLPRHMASDSSSQRARNLAGAIEAAQADIRSVGSAVGYQATICRWYWNL